MLMGCVGTRTGELLMGRYARPNELPLVEMLSTRARAENRALLLTVTLGAVRAIRAEPSLLDTMRRIVLNFDVLVYCKDVLSDPKLSEVISDTIQLEDVLEHLPEKLRQSCDRIERKILRIGIPDLP